MTSIVVDKVDDLKYDLGNLTALDSHDIDIDLYKKNKDSCIKESATQNFQLLVNKLFQLDSNNEDDGLFAKLPKPNTSIPREKPVPKQPEATEWEKFAKDKNMRLRKKDKLVFDEATQTFNPRSGWKRAKPENDWVIDAKPYETPDPNMDPFLFKKQMKKKDMEKEKGHERRNKGIEKEPPSQIKIANTKKLDARGLQTSMKSDFGSAYDAARLSTASMGKFDKLLKNENRNIKVTGKQQYKPNELASKKRKREDSNTGDSEREASMKVLNRVLKVQAKKKTQIKEASVSLYQRSAERDKRKEKKKHLLGENKSRFKPQNMSKKYEE
ncbi:ribosome biogenesis regulatory protein [Acrasis kona]|uniref:Ribosome biogenesis regulatory protein n=1 Tax=Acrasis kona TaxID=1008807 RepID=A0AAW2ZPE9_9EUKA